jgi:uncharacterized LabA/DUF88 family protein
MRSIWVIDGAYLTKASMNFGYFDYIKLKNCIEDIMGEPFTEKYFFDSERFDVNSSNIHSFYTWLKSAAPMGPQIRVLNNYAGKKEVISCSNCGGSVEYYVQQGVDVGIATFILQQGILDRYDRLVFASGDKDFRGALECVRDDLHKEIWLVGFHGSVSSEIQVLAHKVIWMDDIWSKIKLNKDKTEKDNEK